MSWSRQDVNTQTLHDFATSTNFQKTKLNIRFLIDSDKLTRQCCMNQVRQ